MTACRYGCARGLFSNESGMGSAPIVAAAAQSRNPVRQALISSTGTFWDTVVVCLITGLVLVSSILANPAISTIGLEGGELTTLCFAQIPVIGTPLLIFGILTFAYSTILGWSYYGSRCVSYLLGKRAVRPYQVLYVLMAFLGAVGVGNVAWTISDIGNALMAIPNIIVILLLSGMIARETKHYVYDGHLDEEYAEPVPRLHKTPIFPLILQPGNVLRPNCRKLQTQQCILYVYAMTFFVTECNMTLLPKATAE